MIGIEKIQGDGMTESIMNALMFLGGFSIGCLLCHFVSYVKHGHTI